MYNLNGKTALVTGCASKRGIGRAIALRLAQAGADVAINDISQFDVRRSQDDVIEGWSGLRDVETEIRSLGRKTLVVEASIASSQQVEAMVARCMTEFGKIDILVNNAGIVGPRNIPVIELSDEDWVRVLAINLTGTFLCCKAVAMKMVEKRLGGKIINIASTFGKSVLAEGLGAYVASKFGVIGLTQALALELGRHKINVNAVCPGPINTDIGTGGKIREYMRGGLSPEEAIIRSYANTLPRIPLGRVGGPNDIAQVVAFLASSESNFITGQSINVCGGTLMCH